MDTIEKALKKQQANGTTDDGNNSEKSKEPSTVEKSLVASDIQFGSIESSVKDKLESSDSTEEKVLSNVVNHEATLESKNDSQIYSNDNLSVNDLSIKKSIGGGSFQINISDEVLIAHRLIVPNEERSMIKEQYRYIKRSIIDKTFNPDNSVRGKYGNLVMVTSATPGEGKTFTALNLALSIALEQDRKILLVDADVVQPSISNMFNIKSALGITDYLVDNNLEFDRILHKTNIANMTLVLAGNPHYLTNELLASDNMKRLTSELATRYPDRIVLFDTPPLCHTTEASIMASLVGQVIVVVEEGETTDRRLKEALRLVSQHDDVSLLMNKCDSTREGSYYGYY